jgi:N-acetylneuraminic acid mutarotase
VVYNPATNTWTQKASLPVPRERGAAAVLDRKLYIMGGRERRPDGTVVMVRRTTAYDPSTNTWTDRAPMPTQRFDFTASKVLVSGQARISAVGGERPGNHVHYIP